MMLVGALAAFAVGLSTGSLLAGYLAAVCTSMLLALLFAVLTVSLQTNQVATGLALTLFGLGLSAFAGRRFTGLPIHGIRAAADSLGSGSADRGTPAVSLRCGSLWFDPAVLRSRLGAGPHARRACICAPSANHPQLPTHSACR